MLRSSCVLYSLAMESRAATDSSSCISSYGVAAKISARCESGAISISAFFPLFSAMRLRVVSESFPPLYWFAGGPFKLPAVELSES